MLRLVAATVTLVAAVLLTDVFLWLRTPSTMPPESETNLMLDQAFDFGYSIRDKGIPGRFGWHEYGGDQILDQEIGTDYTSGGYSIRPHDTPFYAIPQASLDRLEQQAWSVKANADASIVQARKDDLQIFFDNTAIFTLMRAPTPWRAPILLLAAAVSLLGTLLGLPRTQWWSTLRPPTLATGLITTGGLVFSLVGLLAILNTSTGGRFPYSPMWELFMLPFAIPIWAPAVAAITAGIAAIVVSQLRQRPSANTQSGSG